MSLSRTATYSVTASMSQRGWKRSPSPVGSASREWCETRSETSCPTRSRIGASRASRISRDPSGFRHCARRPWPICLPRRCRRPRQSRSRSSRHACRLSCCPLRTSLTREQQYFAEGITEDLTTDLSRIAGMFVVSRNTAFTYRNKPIDTKQIGRELGVRYVLEGSVRRSGTRVRINAQLIDAETDAHLWAERFDGDTLDLFALQDEVTSRIAVSLNLELVGAEAARPTEHPGALDYILRGRAARLRPNSREVYAEAIGLFEHALALDSQSVEAQSLLASCLVSPVLNG